MKSQATKPVSSKIDLTWATENQTVWIMLPEDHPSGEACNKGFITKLIDEESVQVKIENAEDVVTIKGDKLYPLNNYRDYPNGYDDMVDMENLSEAELLNNLRIRFQLDMIYTYVGPTLIVMNPYKRIEKLLAPTIMKKFQSGMKAEKFELREYMPHVYAIAAMTMKNLLANQKNQAIVISGESGAGKTENTKSAMKFLTSLGKEEDAPVDNSHESIEDKILACNPVLEAFGNAKTLRNDNSSRFGKYVALLVEKDSSKIVGATITNYLLEKSRVVTQNSEERNYHIFYAFLRGASEDTLKKYFLTKDLNEWAFLKNAFTGEVKTVPDDELYKEVMDSFNTMKFSENEQDTIWTYTAAALMVGNIDFDDSGFDDNNPCKLKNEQYLKNVAKILNADFEKLSKALRNKTRVIGGSTIDSTIKKEECIMFRDSFAKELYNKLFNWLVRRLNFTVMPPEFTQGGLNMGALMKKYYHIGLLDIFGFEIFKFNSLEQFCINFSNEKLQQLYIAYVFKGEEKEFISEGLSEYLCELTYKDNQGLIEMLDAVKIPGIFQMLDESCSLTATDQNLYDKIVKQCKKPELPFTTAKLARDTFIIKHTAKEVEYNINGFRVKNKDEISKTIEDAICSSTSADVVKVWKNLCLDETESEEAKNARPNPKDKFLGYKFRVQMKDLMEELNSCECQFIRCLKPNEKKQADFFLPQLVLQQIKYMGVLDTIKVRKDTFPVRTTYKNFYEKYQDLDKKASRISFEKHVEKGSNFEEMAKKICEEKFAHHTETKKILYGNSKLFLRVEAAKEIESIRREIFMRKHRAVKRFQKAWFYFKQIRIWREMIQGMKLLQKTVRARKEYLKFGKLRRTCMQIQKWWRGILLKRRIAKILKFTLFVQNWWKMMFQKLKYKKTMAKIKMINRTIRGAIARRKVRILKACKALVEDFISEGAVIIFENLKIRSAIKIQKCWRGHFCRKNFSKFVEQIRIARENFVKNRSARKIQKRIRGFIVRATLKRMYKAAQFIQGHMRMRWLSTLFQKLRVVAVIIQKAVRRWLIVNKARNEKYQQFMSTEGKGYKNLLIAEQANFFGIYNLSKIEKGVENYLPLLKPRVEEPLQDDGSFEDTQASESFPHHEPLRTQPVGPDGHDMYINPEDFTETFSLNPIRAVDPYTAKKIDLFSKVIDVELLCDTSAIYDPIWSLQMLQLQKECYATGIDTQLIEVGQAHTTVIPSTGKVYSFGWNDCMQLGRATEPGELSSCEQIEFSLENFRPKSIAAGDDHNLLFDYQGTLYTWGDNSKGQLGLGHRKPTPKIIVQDFAPNDPVREIKAKGHNSLAITESGKAYYWPRILSTGERIYRPTELVLPPKTQILTAACGYNFAVLVAKNGLVFTFGQDNKAGQLGHGDTKPRDHPTLVETLKTEGEIVMGVSCGFKHVIVKTKLGKVYSWGWGAKGQLGHGETQNELKPRLVNMSNNQTKIKATQVHAGYAHSIVVLENRKLLWWGTNGSLECQSFPVEVDLQKKISDYQKEFTPLKVLCSWSKTMNVTYVTIADSRTSDINPTTKNKVLATLVSKMEEASAFNEVDIPYVDSLIKYFPLKIMKDRSALAKAPSAIKKMAGIPQLNKASEAGGPPHYCESLAVMRSPKQPLKEPELPQTKQNTLTTPRLTHTKPLLVPPKISGMDSARQYASTGQGQKLPSSIGSPRLLTGMTYKTTHVTETNVAPLASQRGSARNNDKGKMRTTTSGSPPLLSSRNEKEKERKESPRKCQNQKNDELDNLNKKLYDIKKKMEKIKGLPKETWSKADAEFIKITSEPKLFALLETIKLSKDEYNS